MPLKLITGPNLNHLARVAAAQITMTPSALAVAGSPYLCDGRASLPAIFSTGAEDATIAVDTDLLGATGTFESADDAAAWSMLGVGSFTSNTGDAFSGAASGLLSCSGASQAIVYMDITVRPGETLNFSGQFKVDDATSCAVRIRNRATGSWLKSDSTWDPSQQDIATNSGGWDAFSIQFTVEDLDACLTDQPQLRVFFFTNAGDSRMDDVTLFPSVDWFSIHGHNIPPVIVPTLQYSDDGSAWSTQQTVTLLRDSFGCALDSLVAHRYWQLLLDGITDTDTRTFVGEMILGQHRNASRLPAYDGTLTWTDKQTRFQSAVGDEFVHWHGIAPQRKLNFDFALTTDDEYHEFHKLLFRASRGGGNPVVLWFDDLDAEVYIFGRIKEAIGITKSTPTYRTTSLEVLELALPPAPDVAAAYDAPITGE